MSVKELVRLYDLPSTGATSATETFNATSEQTQARRRIPSSAEDESPPPSPTSTPARPARFLNHDHRGLPESSTHVDERHYESDERLNELTSLTVDVTEQPSANRSNLTGPSSPGSGISSSYRHSSSVGTKAAVAIPHNLYPPKSIDVFSSSPTPRSLSFSSTITLVPPRLKSAHTPIPVATVFARNAAPLYLPKLDRYLESLPPPKLPHQKNGSVINSQMFPPMDRLVASKQTIEDLEANSQVAPAWRNRNSIFSGVKSAILGITGSSALAPYYSVQGLFNTVQIFALILSTIVPHGGVDESGKWRKLFLGTIPNILALNVASTLVQSLVLLLILMTISSLLLVYHYWATNRCLRDNFAEGLEPPERKGKQWGLMIATFTLTAMYLPLSTMAIHVLVWSDDLWVVPNPYINTTSLHPAVAPLGSPSLYRDPLDFCWTSTMRKDQVNFAPIVIILSAGVFFSLTLWFPLSLRQLIQQAVPIVDPYTELGRLRSKSEMDREYQRLLARDHSPFSFLYNGFRRGWGTYESTYLFAKLSTLTIITEPDTHRPRNRRIDCNDLLFTLQCIWAPFLDPVNNASEWTSRLNYVATAMVALAVALKLPGQNIISGPILYLIYIVTYGLSFYFLLIDTSLMHRVVKRLARRIDFSIDIFSPRIDISPNSAHVRRRIWQESITTLLLTNPECKIPSMQRMLFAQARECDYPPYLLDFAGSPAERHVENLKILREVGSLAYTKAVSLISGPDFAWFQHLEDEIQKHFVGPDCYWKSPTTPPPRGCTSFFGNAWFVPFPPTVVMKYDDGPHVVIKDVVDLEQYVVQNTSPDIQRKRDIRMSLRALDGQRVTWPYDHVKPIGSRWPWCFGHRRYKAQETVRYISAVLHVKRHGNLLWRNLQLGSGLGIELTYAKRVHVSGDVIGLTDDYDLNPPLARFLALNRDLIPQQLKHIEQTLEDYRAHRRRECQLKARVLSYRFLTFVYNRPRDESALAESSIEFEQDSRVRQLMLDNEVVFDTAFRRLTSVCSSEAATWWYLFWDDLWRRNHDTINKLQLHDTDFNPWYPSSIAYTPLPRPALESFLIQRGLMNKPLRHGDFFHPGFLNKLYIRLNDVVYRGSNKAILFHLGDGESELDMEDVDLETRGRSSSLGTGGGTDHDDASIRARPRYKWEALLDDRPRHGLRKKRRLFAKLGAWFGVTPLWRSSLPGKGVFLDVRLENGRYVLIDYGEDEVE